MSAIAAALRGSREISFTVISMSVSLIAVFIPILLMGGIIGRLFREFAVTLAIAIAVSMVVSLTTTPMMCALFLQDEHGRKHNVAYGLSGRCFESVLKLYEITLAWVLRHPQPTLAVLLIAIGFNVYLYAIVPKGFFPQQDTGRLMGSIQASQDISLRSNPSNGPKLNPSSNDLCFPGRHSARDRSGSTSFPKSPRRRQNRLACKSSAPHCGPGH